MPDVILNAITFFLCVALFYFVFKASQYAHTQKFNMLRKRREEKAERIRSIHANIHLQKEAKSNPDKNFDKRMGSFLECVKPRELTEDSQADYWESPDLEIGPDQPRSVGFIRYLLGKIYKALYSGAKSKGK